MKKLLLPLCLMLAFLPSLSAQKVTGDSIIMVKRFDGFMLLQDGQRITISEAVRMMKSSDEEAYRSMRSASGNNAMATVLSVAGGFMIGWPIGTALGGGDPQWELAAVGTGLVVLAFPFMSQAKKKASKAVELYNQDFTRSAYRNKPELHFSLSEYGAGLCLRF